MLGSPPLFMVYPYYILILKIKNPKNAPFSTKSRPNALKFPKKLKITRHYV
jgi:hypothetical protein